MNLPETMNVTADGIAGQVGIWRVIRRDRNPKGLQPRRGWNKCWVLYEKIRTGESPQPPWRERDAFKYEYKVQVFNQNSQMWREFETIEDAGDFIEKVQKSYFYRGALYKSRKELYEARRPYIRHTHQRTIDAAKAVMDGFDMKFVEKLFELKDRQMVYRELKKNGYVFYPLGAAYHGKWVKKETLNSREAK